MLTALSVYYKAKDIMNQFQVPWDDKRWELVHSLWRWLQRQFPLASCHRTRLEYMAEQFFQYQKQKRFISRFWFLRIMMQTCMMSSSNNNKDRKQREWKSLLNSIYHVMDPFEQDELDWRRLFYMFHVLSFIQVSSNRQHGCSSSSSSSSYTFKDLLLSAFQFYTAENDDITIHHHEDDNTNRTTTCHHPTYRKVPLAEMKHVLEYLIRLDTVPLVMEEINKVYYDRIGLDTGSSSFQGNKLLQDSTPLFMTFSIFQYSLDHWLVHHLSEQEYYPKALLHIMNKYHSLLQTKWFLDEDNRILKKKCIQFWAMKIKRRYRLRHLLQKIFLDDCQRRHKILGFRVLVQHAIQVTCASRIQKHIRGILERTRYKRIRSQNAIATHLQSVARCYLGKHAHRQLIRLRQEAAVTIQRNYRAWKGRKMAHLRFMTQSDQRQVTLDQMQYLQQWQSMNNSFRLLQKRHRMNQRAAFESEKKFKLQREREVEKRIQSALDAYRLERRIFEQQLKEHYDNILQTYEYKRLTEEQSHKHDIEVRILARRREFEKQRLEKAKRDEEKRAQYELQRKKRIEEWIQKAEVQTNLFKEYCHHCFLNPQTITERSLCATIKGAAKKRMQEILQDADRRGEKMESVEAKKVAVDEAMASMVEQEKRRILGRMEDDLSKMEVDYDNSLLESADQEIKQQELSERLASSVITRAARSWLARLSVMRECEETFEKIFDEEYHAFFYKNRKTGEVRWSKPKLMRKSDVPVKDEWKVLRDAQDFPYYYNPCIMKMSWSPPRCHHQVMCANQSVMYTWQKIFPTPQGRCEYFAEPNNHTDNETGLVFCKRCRKSYHSS